MKAYKGDIVVRFNGDKYFVAQTTTGVFHLITEDTKNRWSEKGIEPIEGFPHSYLTLDLIVKEYTNFNAASIIKGYNYKTKLEPVIDKVPVTEPEEPIVIDEADFARAIAYELSGMEGTENMQEVANKLAIGLMSYLEEKGIVEITEEEM